MRFSSKLAVVTGASLLLLAVISSWSYSQFFNNRAKDQLRAHLLSEGLAAKKLAEAEIELLTQKLILLLSEEAALRKMPNPGPNRAFMDSDFVEIALMQTDTNQGFRTEWASMRPGYANRWQAGSHLKLLEELPYSEVGAEFHIVHALKSPDGQPLFALMIPISSGDGEKKPTKIGVGFVTATTFANVMDPFRRAGKEAGLLDESGVALAYTSQQYVGASLAKHPVVNEVIKSLIGQSATKVLPTAENLAGSEVLYSFERLSNSNLIVFVSQEPLAVAGLFGLSTLGVIGYALALMLVLAGIVLWLLKPFENAFSYLQDLVISLAEKLPLRSPIKTGNYLQSISEPLNKILTEGVPTREALEVGPSPAKLQQLKDEAKLSAYNEIGAGLSQALKGPMTAILGQIQLARGKVKDEELKEHFANIEKEARRSRDTIENLIQISGESRTDKRPVDVREALSRALARMQNELSKNGVKVRKELKASGVILANPGQLDTVFEELIRNAMEAMTLSHPKELMLTSVERDGKIILEISDTGSGMSEETLAKVFDPFFTTKTDEDKNGLGLTVAKKLVNGMEGQLLIDSIEGSFTKVFIELPLHEKVYEKPVEASEEKLTVDDLQIGLPETKETPAQRRARIEAEQLLALFDKPSPEDEASPENKNTDTVSGVFKKSATADLDFDLSDLGLPIEPKRGQVEIRKPKVRAPN